MFFSKFKRSAKLCPNGLLSLPQKSDIMSKKELQCLLQQRRQNIHSKGPFLKYIKTLAAKTGSACTTFISLSQKSCQCNYNMKYKNFQIRRKHWQLRKDPCSLCRNKDLHKVHPTMFPLGRCPNQSHKPKHHPWKCSKPFTDGTAREITDYLTAVLRGGLIQ